MKPLNKTSDLLVVDFINEGNPGANLELSKIILGAPADNSGVDNDVRNTMMTIKARKNSGFVGDQGVTYNRLNGTALFLNVTAYLDVKEPGTSTDLLGTLNEQYGLKITADDIVATPIDAGTNAPVTSPEDPDPVPVDHFITFKETCPAYIGGISVKIGARPQVGERLSLVITNTQLDGLVYPDTPVEDKGQAYIYSYGIDCSAIAAFLDKQATGVMSEDTAFAVELNKVVPELWVSDEGSKDYNLKGANVLYVGSTADDGTATGDEAKKPVEGANTAYNKVMLLKLDDAHCSNFTGIMFLHYNA